jgi:hypothetical protein
MLYKWGLMNKPELNKVYHSFHNLFLERIQGVKIRGVSENTLSKASSRISLPSWLAIYLLICCVPILSTKYYLGSAPKWKTWDYFPIPCLFVAITAS